jgi:hypothetical protein
VLRVERRVNLLKVECLVAESHNLCRDQNHTAGQG